MRREMQVKFVGVIDVLSLVCTLGGNGIPYVFVSVMCFVSRRSLCVLGLHTLCLVARIANDISRPSLPQSQDIPTAQYTRARSDDFEGGLTLAGDTELARLA